MQVPILTTFLSLSWTSAQLPCEQAQATLVEDERHMDQRRAVLAESIPDQPSLASHFPDKQNHQADLRTCELSKSLLFQAIDFLRVGRGGGLLCSYNKYMIQHEQKPIMLLVNN